MEGETMKVIFIRDLKGQGKKGEVKEVKDGYGNNFLIKNGYAVLASSGNMTKLKNEEARRGIEETLKVHDMEDIKKELEAKTFEFSAKTGKEGKMFGQISIKQIKEALNKEGFHIDKKQIHLDHPIQSLGTHFVEIELHKKVIAKMKVHVK